MRAASATSSSVADLGIDVRPEPPLARGELQPALDDAGDLISPWPGRRGDRPECLSSWGVSGRPLARAALRGRLAEGDVAVLADGVDLHLVQVEVALAVKAEPHVAGLHSLKRHHERLLVGKAVEHRAVVLVDLAERLAVVRDPDDDPRVTLGQVAAVVEHDPVDGGGLLEIDLPPGVFLHFGVEAPLAVLHAVAAPRGVLLPGHVGPPGRDGGLAQGVLVEPVGLDLCRTESGLHFGRRCLAADHRRPGDSGHAARQQSGRSEEAIQFLHHDAPIPHSHVSVSL